jgi:16S rRNA (uracil1498-N3)-methyltransferase
VKQFLLPNWYAGEPTFHISGKDHHYLKHVLRLGSGDEILGRDRKGNLYHITIEREQKGAFVVHSRARKRELPASAFSIDLYQCLPRGSRMDLIVRQATEVGIHRVIPLISQHTVKRVVGGERIEKKLARWNHIAEQALQQSGARLKPRIERPRTLEALEDRDEGCDILFQWQDSASTNLHRVLMQTPSTINLLIGPEGGFSEMEIEYILGLGFRAVSLGETILRVETAALYAMAAVKTLLLESKSWKTALDESAS